MEGSRDQPRRFTPDELCQTHARRGGENADISNDNECARPVEAEIRRSKIFGVEIYSRFDTESIEIGLQPLVGACATHVVKMLEEIPIGV